jgi:7-cyano-7-deazaguanine synthase
MNAAVIPLNAGHNKAVVLLSGGMDSATTLAIAKGLGFECHALTFDYGQRHRAELNAATRIAGQLGVADHKILKLDLSTIGGSALTEHSIPVPVTSTSDVQGRTNVAGGRTPGATGIPVTYVPARNTVFLALALAWAEVLRAWDIFIGINAVDYSGYPDCRPQFIEAFTKLAGVATKAGVEGGRFTFHTPLIHLSKAEIIREGMRLGVDYALTVSCYAADDDGRACGRCDACRLRVAGFQSAGVADPTRYQ